MGGNYQRILCVRQPIYWDVERLPMIRFLLGFVTAFLALLLAVVVLPVDASGRAEAGKP